MYAYRCPTECECYGLHVDCSGYSACQLRSKTSNTTEVLDIPSTTRGLDLSSNPRLYNMMKLDDLDLPFLFYLNLSDCEIEWFPRTLFFSMRELRTLDISYNKISRLTSNTFLHQTMLEKFVLVGNLKPLTLEPESFTGLSALHSLTLSKLHIVYISRDTFANLDLDALKIVYSTIDAVETHFLGRLRAKAVFLNTTKIKTMFQSMFDGIQTIELFQTDDYKFCCVKPLVVPGDKCFPHQDEISSCDDLIRNEVLVPLIWLIGFISVLTNGASLVYRFVRQRKQLKRNYGIFSSPEPKAQR